MGLLGKTKAELARYATVLRGSELNSAELKAGGRICRNHGLLRLQEGDSIRYHEAEFVCLSGVRCA